MKQIGEFANENQVTVKALHHYEKLGLIHPAKVDEFTGYRYYEENQSKQLSTITRLKALGFSLSEIKDLLEDKMEREYLLDFLYAKKRQAQMDADSASMRYLRIAALIEAMEKVNESDKFDIKEITNMKTEEVSTIREGHELFNMIARGSFEQAADKNKPLCTLCGDIDRFKKINDDFGHDVGDIVIERVMDVALKSLTHIDPENNFDCKIIEHEGGDEFRMMISADVHKCKILAQYIIDKIEDIDFGDISDGINVSATIGIASIDSEKASYSKLFHLAETALYEAKTKQRGTYMVYAE